MVFAVLEAVNSATGCVFATEAGATDPRAEVALTSRLAAANETERIRFEVFAIDRSLVETDCSRKSRRSTVMAVTHQQ
jgi:hypothetical protein